MVRPLRRRVRGTTGASDSGGDEAQADFGPGRDDLFADALTFDDEAGGRTDWFSPEEPEQLEGYVARRDVPLAAMLMVGAQPWQRIDGMGLARKALEAEVTGDARRDLTEDERFLLANGRAWCLVVHGDLGHQGRRDDPFVLADAGRHIELAQHYDPANPAAWSTLALLRLREGRTGESLEAARYAVATFAALPDERRSGQTQAAAVLALVTLGLASAASGDLATAEALGDAARATRRPFDLDEAAFGVLVAELREQDQPNS
jgi:hypothetical protein